MIQASPYQQVLGAAWDGLPDEVRALHRGGRVEASGRASVSRGRHPLGLLVCTLFALPRAAADVAVDVRLEASSGGEVWTRRFGGRVLRSRQRAGRGRDAGLLWERLGLLEFGSALEAKERGLRLSLRRWRILRLPLPLVLAPRVAAFEGGRDGLYTFDIELGHRFTGLIVRYRGWLDPEGGS